MTLYEVQFSDQGCDNWRRSNNGRPGENPFKSLTKAKEFAKKQANHIMNRQTGLVYRVVEINPQPVRAEYRYGGKDR